MESKQAIVFDIDGTLADVEHRRHHVRNGAKDWDKFFAEMVNDPPKQAVCDVAEAIGREYGDPYIFFFTGRPNKYREETERWLREHVPNALSHSQDVMMRADGDFRSDVEVKRAMLRIVESRGYEVKLVIDDRPSVIAMWKEEGIQVLEVDSGDWDETKVEPGKLIMLVGPSGAGKSFYAMETLGVGNTRASCGFYVSSDCIREQMTGDFTDQSKNAEVFQAVHNIAVARITSGLACVIDATNLRNRDRRAILDKMPKDCEIEYHVIDRSLEEKVKHGGWRNHVIIKGQTLIGKHDATFRSNLKAILAGDDDPRVTVKDMRSYAND